MATLPCRAGVILGSGIGGIWCRFFARFHSKCDYNNLHRNSISTPGSGAPAVLDDVTDLRAQYCMRVLHVDPRALGNINSQLSIFIPL